MKKYIVDGMSCAACSARVEKAVSSISGVEGCTVNLLTGTMTVKGKISDEVVINAVKKAGYSAHLEGKDFAKPPKATNTTALIMRLTASVFFLLILMYVSMGHIMWGFPLPSFFEETPAAVGILQLLLTTVVLIINQKFFINGFKALFKLSPNMDTLVALGSAAAFIYSVIELFLLCSDGDHLHLHNMYFESSAMIVTLITVGKMLESYSKGKTTDALKGLLSIAPKTADVIRNSKEMTISVDEVIVGDIFTVKAGQSVPVDAVIIDGSSAIDESALTGESVPADKAKGDNVFAGTISKSGFLTCKATKVGKDTTLSKVIEMVSDASSSKAPIARVADKVSGIFVPFVIMIAVITFAVWMLMGQGVDFALARGISVLVISCPCALGLATPVAIMVGSGVGAKNGILFKTASVLENAGKTQIVVLDKTGTVTKGLPTVTDILEENNQLLLLAASLEQKSEHPLSIAVTETAKEKCIKLYDAYDFQVHSGLGVSGTVNGKRLYGGNLGFIQKYTEIKPYYIKQSEKLATEGKTPLFFCSDSEFLGIIAVADTVKEDSVRAIDRLKRMGLKVIMLTGDNQKTAEAIAKEVNIDNVIAQVLPDEKAYNIKKLQKQGRVMMVGDGINDAPSLAVADTGVAMSGGTDIAADSADIVLMNNRLSDVSAAITLSRKTLSNIYQNLFWAFIYNTLGIPLAAGVFTSLLGWDMNPMFAAAAMSLSSFCVVTNALRLNLVKIHSAKTKKQNTVKEKNIMKTLKIEGMMCPHCEARVKALLEEIKEVEAAKVSHKEGTATLTLKKEISDEKLIKAVTNGGYKVISIS
ncbi:MAG: heavy metal translocating P-type ATPase [Acutalibacteraceae bacterium]|nr:heavy metal translocating P-type ATPase [Acutalibacteraceae bacterium]